MLKRFLQDESGATAIEYALIASLVSLAIIGGATAIGTSTTVTMTSIADHLQVSGDTP